MLLRLPPITTFIEQPRYGTGCFLPVISSASSNQTQLLFRLKFPFSESHAASGQHPRDPNSDETHGLSGAVLCAARLFTSSGYQHIIGPTTCWLRGSTSIVQSLIVADFDTHQMATDFVIVFLIALGVLFSGVTQLLLLLAVFFVCMLSLLTNLPSLHAYQCSHHPIGTTAHADGIRPVFRLDPPDVSPSIVAPGLC